MGTFKGEEARVEYYRAAKRVIALARLLADHVERLDISAPTHENVNDMIYANKELESILANYFGIGGNE